MVTLIRQVRDAADNRIRVSTSAQPSGTYVIQKRGAGAEHPVDPRKALWYIVCVTLHESSWPFPRGEETNRRATTTMRVLVDHF